MPCYSTSTILVLVFGVGFVFTKEERNVHTVFQDIFLPGFPAQNSRPKWACKTRNNFGKGQ